MNRITRIQKMEATMERVSKAIDSRDSLSPSLREDIRVLNHYYQTEWMDDYLADERGEIPDHIKRGILSEDSLYDLLCACDALFSKNG